MWLEWREKGLEQVTSVELPGLRTVIRKARRRMRGNDAGALG